MEIRHLKLIKAIAEEGSLTKAIDKLHLTQSALSHQLREAESTIGTRLFDRVNKKMVLTKAGEKLYETALEILGKLDQAEADIKRLVYGETGIIRLGAECYTSYHWLPPVMKQFHSLYPNVDLQLIMAATHYPVEKLLTGDIDLAITSDPVKDSRIKFIELFQDEMVAVFPDGHRWGEKKYLLPEDFVNENLIIHSLPLETVTAHQFFLKPAKVSPAKVTPVPLTEAALEMVKADMGVMVMAKWSLKNFINDPAIRTIKLGKGGLKRKHFIGILKNRKQPRFIHQFIDFMQKEINV